MKPKLKHIIVDWTGSRKFGQNSFDSLEEASGYLTEQLHKLNPDATEEEFEQILGEFHIEKKWMEE